MDIVEASDDLSAIEGESFRAYVARLIADRPDGGEPDAIAESLIDP